MLCACALLAASYPWLSGADPQQALAARIAPPAGYEREAVDPGSFAEWLRHLPLKPGWAQVHLHDGGLKGNQAAHAAVVDIDVGRRDLQQCADAVMRLRAEYLFGAGRAEAIRFNFTNGTPAAFADWARGARPRVDGSRVRWVISAVADPSHGSLRRYLDVVFMYAGSMSLAGELQHADVSQLRGGDVFIQGGFPGHAVIVVDTARDGASGRRVFLLAQSYMPAQEIHILRNPEREDPWYEIPLARPLRTPEWTFPPDSLRRFR
jgi:hypothetical protein